MESQEVSKNHQSSYLEQERLLGELEEALNTHPKFILVVHEWWIDSLGFKVTPLDCKTKEDAFVEGLMVQHKILSDRRFRKVDFTIIELESGLVVARSIRRRLTLWERLTGYVNQ